MVYRLTNRNTEVFALIGRLAPGVTRRQARSALQLTTTQLAQAYPGETRKTSLPQMEGLSSLSDEDVMPLIVTPLVLGFGLTSFDCLCERCTSALTRSAGRQREIALRLALGREQGESCTDGMSNRKRRIGFGRQFCRTDCRGVDVKCALSNRS